MKIVSTGYVNTAGFSDPEAWISRISFFTGILEELAKYHEVHSIEQINYRGKLKKGGVQYHFIDYSKPKLYFPFALHQYIQSLHPDIVLVNGLSFPLQLIQLRWKLGNKVRIIAIHHADKPRTGIRKILQKRADRYTDAYLFVTKEMGKDWVRAGIIGDKYKIAEAMEASSNFKCIDRKLAIEKTGAAGNPVFLWVGRLDRNKDPLTLLKAFHEFRQRQPEAKLFMFYHTEELIDVIKHYILDKDLGNNIILKGRLPHDDLLYWYNSADFFISASHYEGSGVAVCEAMSCGCIPILSDIPSFRKMTGPSRCGFLFEPGNEMDLLNQLNKTMKMDKIEERNKVLKQFHAELSFSAIAGKINNLIKSFPG